MKVTLEGTPGELWLCLDNGEEEGRRVDQLIAEARREALEEAAKAAEPDPECAYHYEVRDALNKVAATIRARATKEPQP